MISKKLVLSVIGAMIVLGSTAAVAREASEGPRGADRVHSGTHKNSVDVDGFIVAREAGEGPRGEGKGHPNGVDASNMILAREASEGPRGADHPKGTHKLGTDAGEFILAREASEGPRGADNERPGDRQRRGGRTA